MELRDADEKHDFGSLAVHNFNCEGELGDAFNELRGGGNQKENVSTCGGLKLHNVEVSTWESTRAKEGLNGYPLNRDASNENKNKKRKAPMRNAVGENKQKKQKTSKLEIARYVNKDLVQTFLCNTYIQADQGVSLKYIASEDEKIRYSYSSLYDKGEISDRDRDRKRYFNNGKMGFIYTRKVNEYKVGLCVTATGNEKVRELRCR